LCVILSPLTVTRDKEKGYMQLKFTPIKPDRKSMEKYLINDFCKEVYNVYEQLYPKIGFNIPWIGYFILNHNEVVGVGGYKGPPNNNKIEIAYGVVPEKEGQGFATKICKQLTIMALKENPTIRVFARTLMEEGASTNILRKNCFKFIGTIEDAEDGQVWEWEFKNE
jgi:RimJ/RimL family protein N-acetyltransferase